MKTWFRQKMFGKAPIEPAEVAPEAAAAADALIERGNVLEDQGAVVQALAVYEQALVQNPRSARACLNAGNALRLLNDDQAAIEMYRKAAELDPRSAGARVNLGTALLSAGQAREAEDAYRQALALNPDWAEACIGLGCAREALGAEEEAIAAYSRALALQPGHAGAVDNLSSLQLRRLDVAGARRTLESYLLEAPQQRDMLRRLADLEETAGRIGRSIELHREWLAQAPEDWPAWHAMLFRMLYLPGVTPEQSLQEHERFGRLMESRIAALPLPAPDARDRRLRLGYVSGDFFVHPIANFIHPVLRCHDRDHFETFCYHTLDNADWMTAELRALSDHWCAAGGLDDAALTERIRRDGIDILVDLSGHSYGNRLGVFARKPAPAQFTWLGHLGTTGLTRMDYRLCDACTDPPGRAEAWQTETPVRLPHSQWCYDQRLVQVPEVSALPRRAQGHWTFGSFNNYRKLNDEVFTAWAGVLQAVPDSRLRLYSFENPESGERAVDVLAGHGIARARISWHLRGSPQQHFATFADVDVALDAFPYNGATTTLDCLLMGVPVLAVAGERAVSRGGLSLLTTLGMSDWVADRPPDLAGLAQRHLADVEAMARLRAGLRGRLQASPLMDAPGFTRRLEQEYRNAWRRWCDAAGAAAH